LTEDRLRRRLAEILGAAGVPSGTIAAQVLFLMPQDFADAYQELFHRALKGAEGEGGGAGRGVGDGGAPDPEPLEAAERRLREQRRGNAPSGMRVRSSQEVASLRARGGGKRHRDHWTIRSEEALEQKRRVDRKLRRLGREIRGFLGEGGDPSGRDRDSALRRCSARSCRKFVEEGWKFCPSCGHDQRARKGKSGDERAAG
jgi:hypothetical protein